MKNSFYLPKPKTNALKRSKPKTNALKRSFFYNALFHLNKLNITQDRLSDAKTLFLNSISYINENLSHEFTDLATIFLYYYYLMFLNNLLYFLFL